MAVLHRTIKNCAPPANARAIVAIAPQSAFTQNSPYWAHGSGMAHFTPHQPDLAAAESPTEIVAALCAVHRLVANLAGQEASDIAFDADSARLDERYRMAPTLLRGRFDMIAADVATYSAAGLAAIVALDADRIDTRTAAAGRLSAEMRRSITTLIARLPG
jgi:hypothetical protein